MYHRKGQDKQSVDLGSRHILLYPARVRWDQQDMLKAASVSIAVLPGSALVFQVWTEEEGLYTDNSAFFL